MFIVVQMTLCSSAWGFSELGTYLRGTSAKLSRPVVVLGANFHPRFPLKNDETHLDCGNV